MLGNILAVVLVVTGLAIAIAMTKTPPRGYYRDRYDSVNRGALWVIFPLAGLWSSYKHFHKHNANH